MKLKLILLLFAHLFAIALIGQNEPLKIGVIGLSHTHVHWIFNSVKSGDFEIVTVTLIPKLNKNVVLNQCIEVFKKIWFVLDIM